MDPNDASPDAPLSEEPRLATRRPVAEEAPVARRRRDDYPVRERRSGQGRRGQGRVVRAALWLVPLLMLAGLAAYFGVQSWLRSATRAALPQIDGTLALPGLSAPVTVLRDGHGVPHLRATTLDDLVVAQGFITAQDRLFQMDLLRRHAAGELAAILGPSLAEHDRAQRTLGIRAAADQSVETLPPDEARLLAGYARGVNAAIDLARQHGTLPVEFRLLRYDPAPWTPRDSLLVARALFEDLTNSFPTKLAREKLSAQLPAELVADLYPAGSWRDHPPSVPEPDLTVPGPPIEQVPLDESQAALELPARVPSLTASLTASPTASLTRSLSEAFNAPALGTQTCAGCTPGSNNWVVSGAHTASGKPLLANDMHLNLTVPGIWYEADLATTTADGGAEALHVAGVSLPGTPLIVVGHNAHIAWGFTNLGADVEDVYVEQTRGRGKDAEFQAVDGSWQPVVHTAERIVVRGGADQTVDVTATRHGGALCPIVTALVKGETRTVALRWSMFDTHDLGLPAYDLARARDWPGFLAAMARFDGPSQNAVYADDQGHIGYHAVGRVPMRGPARNPALGLALPVTVAAPDAPPPANQTPVIAAVPDPLAASAVAAPKTPAAPQRAGALSGIPVVPALANEWSGYISFDQLPAIFDPPGGIIATANARITPDDYAYPVTLNWGGPYRNERIWRLLAHRNGLTAADMLAIQSDIYSEFNHVLAERLAYAVDHAASVQAAHSPDQARLLRAADLLRTFNGQMTGDSPAAALLMATHNLLWPMLLAPHLEASKGSSLSPAELNALYVWGEQDYALEQLLMHRPPRWLPAGYATWDDLLAATLERALKDTQAPEDLGKLRYGSVHTVDLEHPVFGQSPLLQRMLGMATGTGSRPQSGDRTTIKQVGRTFGPSERFTADLGDPDRSTLNIVMGQSGNPASPWYADQFSAWYRVTTFGFPFSEAAVARAAGGHTLTLTPR